MSIARRFRGCALRLGLGIGLVSGFVRDASANFDWAGHAELDAQGLTSDDADKRAQAVSDLGKYDLALVEKYLLKALADDKDTVRHAAARVLGQGQSQAAVPLMIAWLGDADPKTRQVAAEVLGDIGGPDATASLTRSLGDQDSTVRQRAVKALGSIARRGNPNVVIALIPRLEDEKSEVRIATIAQLEELGDRRSVIPLVARFGDTSNEAKKAAVRAVGRLGDPSAVPALIRLMNDPSEDVRSAAVGSLGNLAAVDAIDALTEQLTTGGDTYRTKVAYALGQIAASPSAGKAGEEAMRTLVGQLAQPTQRAAAREALRIGGKAAVPALVSQLAGRIPGDPATTVGLLAEAADARATATLAAELERGRVAMPLVLKALGATGDPQALVPVLGALSSKDPAIRLAAMEALRPLIGNDTRAGDVLTAHLSDDDLEVRVLAAEYLGMLRWAPAAAKLTALAAAGNPLRLRHAAIDALGSIGKPEATKMLLEVLREGPADLHRSAATALSYIADPSSIALLVAQAQADRGPTRYHVVRALGATLRGHPDAEGHKLLRTLADDANIKVSLAAIAGLAGANDPNDVGLLTTVVEHGASDRRRAAASALGELHQLAAIDVLASVLGTKDDRLVGDAAWALGEIVSATVSATPRQPRAAELADRWLFVAKHGGWAAAIDGSGALARVLWALPREARKDLLAGPRRAALFALVFHKSRLVRCNVALALGSLAGDDEAAKVLVQMIHDEASPHARAAAMRALSRVGGASAAAALKLASAADPDPSLRGAAQALASPPIALTDFWLSWYVIDPSSDDAPVRQEPYFVQGPDEVVWATYTDARGELTRWHFVAGASTAWAANRESEY